MLAIIGDGSPVNRMSHIQIDSVPNLNLAPALDEEDRLEALNRYALLDTVPETSFDDLVAMAARYFDVPYSVTSLIDRDRIWFKARFGIDDPEVTRTPGLCATAIQQDDIYHLFDASLDPVAQHHPLVQPADGIRFYAGAPLQSRDGHNVGSICVMGHECRELSEDDRKFLESVSRLTINEIERRYAQKQLEILNKELDMRVQLRTRELDATIVDLKKEAFERSRANEALLASERRQRQIAELSSDCCFEVELEPGRNARLLWFTGPIETITGWSVEDVDLANWNQYVQPDDMAHLAELFDSANAKGDAEFDARMANTGGSASI
jgi:GAF domain-containing protein